MAGPKKSSLLTTKKPKEKAAKATTATKPSLSSEFVVDSDEDEKTASVVKPASKTANAKSNPAKSAEPKVSTSQAKSSKKRKSPIPSPEKDGSSGSGSGEDSSNEDEKSPSKKRILAVQDGSPTPRTKPATARPVLAKPPIKPSTQIKPLSQNKNSGTGASKDQSKDESGESSEDGSSGSESESASGSESISGSSDKTSLQSPRKKSPVRKTIPQQSTKTFQPPVGFESTSISLHPASKLSEIIAPSNLQGKQIWHITAPESVPITLVKEVSTQDISNGTSILEYHGAKYGLVLESDVEQTSGRALLLPSSKTNAYRPSKTAIIKTLHLQQLVNLPSRASEPIVPPNSSASALESYRKTPRQQPEGLRMRYRPFGTSDDSDLDFDAESRPKAPEFRIPEPVKESSPGKKRKRRESHDASSNVSSAVKPKRRKQSPQATAGAIEDPIDVEAIVDTRSNGVESPTKSLHPEADGQKSNDKPPNANETKEERRKRRQKPKVENPSSPSKPVTALPLDVKQDAETIQPGEVIETIPTMANAVEGTKSISISESKSDKAKRREEKRRRKEAERASRGASMVSTEIVDRRAESQDQMMREIEDAQREAEIRIPTPGEDVPKLPANSAHVSQDSTIDSTQTSQRKETKEERAKRKEEKRRRREERGRA